jgi:hypothetical protein
MLTVLKVVCFSQDLLRPCLDQQVGVASVSPSSQVVAFITDRMKPERMCYGGIRSHNICASLHQNRLPGLKIEMYMHTQHCGLISILLSFKEGCARTV